MILNLLGVFEGRQNRMRNKKENRKKKRKEKKKKRREKREKKQKKQKKQERKKGGSSIKNQPPPTFQFLPHVLFLEWTVTIC